VNISGGTVQGTNTRSGVYGPVNVFDGALITAVNGTAINGVPNITGGTISSTGTGTAIRISGTTPITISGATISANTGSAINVNVTATSGNNTLTISGDTSVTSANNSATSGTIQYANASTSVNVMGITINGTVTNTAANGNAVYNTSYRTVNIIDGTVSANGYAVQCTATFTSVGTGEVILRGSPTITGRIQPAAAARGVNVTGTPAFNPGSKVYTIDLASYTTGKIAVYGGSGNLSNFTLYNQPTWKLAVSGSDLVIAAN
jgi:hypothetical protein